MNLANKNFKLIYYIGYILIFFICFVIKLVPGTNIFIPVSFPFLLLFFILFGFIIKNKLPSLIKKLFKMKIIKCWIFMTASIILIALFHILLGHYHANILHYVAQFRDFIIPIIFIYFYPLIGSFFGVSSKKLIKLFYIVVFLIFVLGIIQYLAALMNIDIVLKLFDIFTNQRDLIYGQSEDLYTQIRVFSIFDEPSGFGQFIFITMPLYFNIKNEKEPIMKNCDLNKIMKWSMIPLMLINIIIIQSAMYFVLCFAEFFILCFLHYRKFYIKNLKIFIIFIFVFVITISIFILCILTNYSEMQSQSVLKRISLTIMSIGNLDTLIKLEPSLATRIISYRELLMIFKENVIFGVGYANVSSYAYYFFQSPPMVQTNETLKNFYISPGFVKLNTGAMYTILASSGIIGFITYVMFISSNILILKKIKKYFNGIYYNFCQGLEYSLYFVILLSFYNLHFTNYVLWLIFGFVLLFSFNIYSLFHKGNM